MFHRSMKYRCARSVTLRPMNTSYPIATIGELIGDPARAAILITLLDKRARTAGELAFAGNISAQSASGHLSKLLDGGLLVVRKSGRHRYYSLSSAEVAHAIEALGAIATNSHSHDTSQPRISRDLYLARTCYDHLAGRIAVELAGNLQKAGVIRARGERDFELGPAGKRWFANLSIDVDELRHSRRCFARQCVDWTERRPHLAGVLGAALCSRFITAGWMARRRDTRALRITEQGQHEFRKRFGIALPANPG
jgi:DNA-binding transcriptional ArsR family regulator